MYYKLCTYENIDKGTNIKDLLVSVYINVIWLSSNEHKSSYNHTLICTWKQPVQSNKFNCSLFKQTKSA